MARDSWARPLHGYLRLHTRRGDSPTGRGRALAALRPPVETKSTRSSLRDEKRDAFLSSGLESREASITYRVDANNRLIHTRCVGLITFEQVIRHFRELQRDSVCPDRVDVFLDLREITSLPESGQLSAVRNEIASIRERVAFGICAIVAGGDELFAMMRVFEGLTQHIFVRSACSG